MARRPAQKKEEKLKDKPESPLSVASAIFQMALMLIGLVGIAVLIFGEKGLLRTMGSRLANMDFAAVLMGMLLLFVVAVVGRNWYERLSTRTAAAATGDLAMYIMMAIGAYYLIQFLLTGSFYG